MDIQQILQRIDIMVNFFSMITSQDGTINCLQEEDKSKL